jgi:hypothetical protein
MLNKPHSIKLDPSPAAGIHAGDRRVDWVLAAPVLLSAALALLGLRLALHVPEPLLVVLGATFMIWSVVFWALFQGGRGSVYRRTALWLGPWLAGVLLVMGLVYQVDRAGWMWFRLTGYNTAWAEDLTAETRLSAAEFLARQPAFDADPRDLSRVVLPAGTHDFAATVVLPEGVALTIAPGAVLRFGAGRSLLAYAPVTARGTLDQPIVFTAKRPWLKWGVVGVVGAGPSVFEHVTFAHGREAEVNGLSLVGGLTLLEADAEIAHSAFGPMYGKDAIYVRGGMVDIHDNEIRDAFKDGLDFDGGRGTVRGNRFVDCADEGIDLSGELDLQVTGNSVLDARGGRIAAEAGLDALIQRNELGYSEGNGPGR